VQWLNVEADGAILMNALRLRDFANVSISEYSKHSL
jgi:hypothetical protein